MADLNIAAVVDAAEAAGQVILSYFDKAMQIVEKTSAKNVVTEADTAAEQLIVQRLQAAFPDFTINAEESGTIDKQSDYTIIIDPLDGTSNFLMGIPTFVVSIAVVDKNGRSFITRCSSALIPRRPARAPFYKGSRSMLIPWPTAPRLPSALAAGMNPLADYCLKLIESTSQLPLKRLMENWSPAYEFCLLASGKIEAIISNGLDLEDYAAGKLIVREAGGSITDFAGQTLQDDRRDVFIASNGTALHRQLLTVV